MDLREQAQQEIDVREVQKIKRHRRIKILLISLNFLLIGYALFYLVLDARNFVLDVFDSRSTQVIKICNKNNRSSKKIYQDLAGSGNVIINDFAFAGEQLMLSEYQIAPRPEMAEGQLRLINACDKSQVVSFDFANDYNDSWINLKQLSAGDYLVKYITKDGQTRNLTTPLNIESKIFLLPDQNGVRYSATLKGKDANPNLVLSVKRDNLPKNQVDIVIAHRQKRFLDEIILDSLSNNKHMKIEFIADTKKEDIMEVFYQKQPRYSIIIDDVLSSNKIESIISQYYSKNMTFTSADFSLKKEALLAPYQEYDANYFIRESGGKATGAMTCNRDIDSSCSLVKYQDSKNIGTISNVINFNPNIVNDQEHLFASFWQEYKDFYKQMIGGV